MTPELRTERLLLDPYVPRDEEEFVALFQSGEVSRCTGAADGPSSRATGRAVFRRLFTHVYPLGLFDVWAVRHDGRLVGHAEIKPAEAVDGHELTHSLASGAGDDRLGTELAEALVTYSFYVLGLPRLYATVAAPNAASLVLLRGIGFEHVRDIHETDGRVNCLLARELPATTGLSGTGPAGVAGTARGR